MYSIRNEFEWGYNKRMKNIDKNGSSGRCSSLDELLENIGDVDGSDRSVKFGEVLDSVGRSSFGPLLALAGVVTLFPIIGDIPGVPTVMAMIVLLTCVQMLLGQGHFWLPSWLLERQISKDKLRKAVNYSRRPARYIDHFIGPRLPALTGRVGSYTIGADGIIVALAMPFMEFIPFSANIAGAALLMLGLALMVRDGVLAILAHALVVACIGVILMVFL